MEMFQTPAGVEAEAFVDGLQKKYLTGTPSDAVAAVCLLAQSAPTLPIGAALDLLSRVRGFSVVGQSVLLDPEKSDTSL